MTGEERCVYSDLPKSMCGHCKRELLVDTGELVIQSDDLKRIRPREARYGPWIVARFDSDCDGPCGGAIDEGEHTRSDGEGGWLCELCGGYDG
jgi:hypothetical protein